MQAIRLSIVITFHLLCIVTSVSCTSKTTSSKDEQMIVSEFAEVQMESKETQTIQKECFNAFGNAIETLGTDRMAKIDTVLLNQICRRADSATELRLSLLNQVEEVDSQIMLKAKAISLNQEIKSIISNQFRECIKVFGTEDKNRYFKAAHILKPSIDQYYVNARALDDAENEFLRNHNLEIVDSIPKPR